MQNDSPQYEMADGLIYMSDASMEPYINYGWVVAFRKIDKNDYRAGNCFYEDYIREKADRLN